MRILVLGATGMLGHKLVQALAAQDEVIGAIRGDPARWSGHPVLGTAKLVGGLQAADLDSLVRLFAQTQPDVVINCVGIIKQLNEAHDPPTCLLINSLLPHRLAALCRARGARLLHISTDCVFDGVRGQYRESDASNATDLYGRTKFLGEVDGPGCLTLRTSIVGRELQSHVSLFDWFIRQRGQRVRGYTRAIYTGLTTLELAAVISQVLHQWPQLHGLYHVASAPITKYDLLALLNHAMHLEVTLERDDQLACDRSLLGTRFQQATGYVAPTWAEQVARLAADPTPYPL